MYDRPLNVMPRTPCGTRALIAIFLAGCSSASGNAVPQDASINGMSDGAAVDAAAVVLDSAANAATGPALTLSLDPTLDQPDDDVKTTAITSAKLFDTKGVVKVVATVSGGSAVFPLAGLSAGDYFVQVNGDADDAVPTRIDNPAFSLTQTVGQKLRSSYVGPPGAPTYRINTYSAGQKESPVVRYSDGTTIPGEQPFVIVSFATPTVEFRLLGSDALLSTHTPNAVHAYDSTQFDAWMINTTNLDHHGDMFTADGGAESCAQCHWSGSAKKYRPSVISVTDGWCYGCHYGPAGSAAGFIDPTK